MQLFDDSEFMIQKSGRIQESIPNAPTISAVQNLLTESFLLNSL